MCKNDKIIQKAILSCLAPESWIKMVLLNEIMGRKEIYKLRFVALFHD